MLRSVIFVCFSLIISKTRGQYGVDLLPDITECLIKIEDKIIGGEKAKIDESPWLALLEYQTNHGYERYCVGSLINRNYVLTAAHCIHEASRYEAKLTKVILGEFDLRTDEDCDSYNRCAPPKISIPINKTIIHEGYDKKTDTPKDDIALIRLAYDIPYSEFIRPICLPLPGTSFIKQSSIQKAIISGWGFNKYNKINYVKVKAAVPIKSRSDCEVTGPKLSSKQLCAGDERGDTCSRDSGGPLVATASYQSNYIWALMGVVSYGSFPCAQGPAVYSNVQEYVDWIVDKLEP